MEFRDLKAQYEKYKYEIDSAIQEVINNTNFIGGKEVAELEEQFDIEIEAAEIIPENLNSVDAIWKMIQRLKEN